MKYFLEVARELNFTRAAENLNISPSAVSRSIALLEASVSRRLFVRSKRHVALSAFGETLKASAQRIFDEVERARLDLAGETAEPARLRVGSREMITHYLLPGPLEEYKARWSHTVFGLFELEPAAMAEAVKKDQLDLGFAYADNPDQALESRHLGRLRSHIYVSKNYLRKHSKPKSLREVLEHPFIAPRAFAAEASSPGPDGFPDHRLKRNIRYEAEYLETHRRFVLSGLCLGVLPDLVMEEERRSGSVVILEGPPIYRDIYWFSRKGRTLPAPVEFLLKSMRRVIRALAE